MHLVHVARVVTLGPERAVITGLPVLRAFDVVHHPGTDLRIRPGQHGSREHVQVLALETAGRDDTAVRAVVVVPAGDPGDRDDRLQALDAGRRHRVRQRAVVGHPDHPGTAGRPVRPDPVAVRVESFRPPVQPVDDGLHPERLVAPARGRAAGRTTGAEAVGENHRVSPRHEIIVQVTGERDALGPVDGRALRDGGGAVPVDVVMIGYVVEPGVIRARLEDDGDFPARRGSDDPHGDPVGLPVEVAVHAGLHPHLFADGLRVVVGRLGARWRGRRRRGARGRRHQKNGNHGNRCGKSHRVTISPFINRREGAAGARQRPPPASAEQLQQGGQCKAGEAARGDTQRGRRGQNFADTGMSSAWHAQCGTRGARTGGARGEAEWTLDAEDGAGPPARVRGLSRLSHAGSATPG